MNKTVTKIISTLMVVALLLCCTVTSPNIRVSAAANGTCGENLTWVLDDEGTLTISGTGKMDDFNWNDTPWHRAGNKNDIKEVVIGDDVTSIGDDAFADLGALSKVTIGNSVTEIGYDAFYNCIELTYVRIPDSVTLIGKNAFYSCCSLTGIYIADNVTTIGKDAFSYCPALAEFEVSEQNENYCDIDGVLFTKDKKTLLLYPNSKGAEYSVPYGVEQIGDYAFFTCTGLTDVIISDSVTAIGRYAFSECDGLISATIGKSVTIINNCAFRYCSNLAYINIPESVSTIGEYVFVSCDLTNFTIGTGVKTIGEGAFYECTGLTYVNIPAGVETIGDYAFIYCYALTEFDVSDQNKNYCDIDGVLFTKDKKTIVAYPNSTGDKEYAIPNGVTTIQNHAFCANRSLTNVIIPNSVTTIESYAFCECSNLKNVNIPDSVLTLGFYAFGDSGELANVTLSRNMKSISSYTFSYCSALRSIVIPDSVTEISNSAFEYCWNLKNIVISDSVTSIGDCAFLECESLKDIFYYGTEEQWNNIAIEGGNDSLINATVHFLTRLSGATRYDTAVAISNQGWESADTVILANGTNYADALAGVPLAYKLNAPILLTENWGDIESNVAAQIEKLGASKVIILGGYKVVSQQIEDTLSEKYTVERIKGATRYDTAVAISERVSEIPETAIVVTGTGYADALSISPYAAMKGYPIVYTDPATGLTDSTVNYLSSAKDIIIIGGYKVVRENTVAQLEGKNIDRIYGSSRYLTSYEIANRFSSEFGNDVMLATGTSFPDALTGGVLAAKLKTPLLLTEKPAVINEIKNFILDKSPSNIYILGGEKIMPTSIVENIYA